MDVAESRRVQPIRIQVVIGVPSFRWSHGMLPGSIEPFQREPITKSLPAAKPFYEGRDLAEVVRAIGVAHQNPAAADVRDCVDVRRVPRPRFGVRSTPCAAFEREFRSLVFAAVDDEDLTPHAGPARPSKHHSTKVVIVTASLRAGMTIDNSGSGSSISGRSSSISASASESCWVIAASTPARLRRLRPRAGLAEETTPDVER